MRAFWDIAPCSLMMAAVCVSEMSVYSNKTTYGTISQKALLFILTTVRTQNLTKEINASSATY
jgi:hypothetical protein